jgi:hypothetical protein
VEDAVEAQSEGLEGIWTDIAIEREAATDGREREGEQVKGKLNVDAKSTRVETQMELGVDSGCTTMLTCHDYCRRHQETSRGR